MLEFDHIAVAGESLEAATSHVEEALGIKLGAVGHHALMGTHNRLLSLGPDLYLEAIAIDPEASGPERPRWFDLDRRQGPPGIGNWIARCDDLRSVLRGNPLSMGVPISLQRADFKWDMAVPEDGILPFDGAVPALIEWHGTAHPAPRLPDQGCRLRQFTVRHPEAAAVRAAFPALADLPQVTIEAGSAGFEAEILTPHGPRVLT